jgi:clan AA aspartic protease
MIIGRVTEALDAVAPVGIIIRSDSIVEIDAVVDTGFNGTLAIPKKLAHQIGLKPVGSNEVTLADGQIATLQCCEVSIKWAGSRRDAAAWIVEQGCLVGMELLLGCRLQIDVAPGGDVSIDA